MHLFSFMENDDKREEILQVVWLIDICDEVWIYGDSEGCKRKGLCSFSREKASKSLVIENGAQQINPDNC